MGLGLVRLEEVDARHERLGLARAGTVLALRDFEREALRRVEERHGDQCGLGGSARPCRQAGR